MADWPDSFVIGTKKAFERGYAYQYTKDNIAGEYIYVCDKGSQWRNAEEFLVLRYKDGYWTAWDSKKGDGRLLCRQPIFRCSEDIVKPGWYNWETNYNANQDQDAGAGTDWREGLWAETRRG